jgi:hypothetical protein
MYLTNNGRPDIFANMTHAGTGAGFALGMTPLDDVFRVHAQTRQRAMRRYPWLNPTQMNCAVSPHPTIEVFDPVFAMAPHSEHTMELALYPFTECTDYYCFVNSQRHDLQSDTLLLPRAGILNPPDSTFGDTSVYNTTCLSPNGTADNATGSGCYSGCVDPWAASTKEEKLAHAGTCWESWSPAQFGAFLETQSGPGGWCHVSVGDMIGDGPCGMQQCSGPCVSNATVRPARFTNYTARLVQRTAEANALLPAGVPKHRVAMYSHSQIAPVWTTAWPHDKGQNFTDYLDQYGECKVLGREGEQLYYQNCTAKFHSNTTRLGLPMFYADGTNAYTKVLDDYYAFALDEMGIDGIFHDEFPFSKYSFTYGDDRWDNHSAFLDPKTLSVRAKVGSIVLLTHENEMRMYEGLIGRPGDKFMVANGAPQTRSWFELMAAHPRRAAVCENENSQAWSIVHTQLYTPVGLTRYGGNLRDLDPRYNHTQLFPDDPKRRLVAMMQPCLSM